MRNLFGLAGPSIAVAVLAAGTSPASAAQTYSYEVEHPTYGDIGTYTDTIERIGDTMRIDTKLVP